MSNFPIENMVKLTYNIYGVDIMAEFCLECWNRINETNFTLFARHDFLLSFETKE